MPTNRRSGLTPGRRSSLTSPQDTSRITMHLKTDLRAGEWVYNPETREYTWIAED